MKMVDAMKIIEGNGNGFMVGFEWIDGCILRSDHFPDKHGGEPLISTEDRAWVLAKAFANKMKGKIKNVYVVDFSFNPVPGYKIKMLNAKAI